VHEQPPGGVGGTMCGGVGGVGVLTQPVVQCAKPTWDAPAVAAYSPSPASSAHRAPMAIAFICTPLLCWSGDGACRADDSCWTRGTLRTDQVTRTRPGGVNPSAVRVGPRGAAPHVG
jgi:hypothetical protein